MRVSLCAGLGRAAFMTKVMLARASIIYHNQHMCQSVTFQMGMLVAGKNAMMDAIWIHSQSGTLSEVVEDDIGSDCGVVYIVYRYMH